MAFTCCPFCLRFANIDKSSHYSLTNKSNDNCQKRVGFLDEERKNELERFLIFYQKLTRKSITEFTDINDKNKNVVSFCDDCFLIAQSFNKLYNELEILEVKIKEKMCALRDTIKLSGRIPDRIIRFRRKMNRKTTNDCEDITFIDEFRTQFLFQTDSFINTTCFKVGLDQRLPKSTIISLSLEKDHSESNLVQLEEDTTDSNILNSEIDIKVEYDDEQSQSPALEHMDTDEVSVNVDEDVLENNDDDWSVEGTLLKEESESMESEENKEIEECESQVVYLQVSSNRKTNEFENDLDKESESEEDGEPTHNNKKIDSLEVKTTEKTTRERSELKNINCLVITEDGLTIDEWANRRNAPYECQVINCPSKPFHTENEFFIHQKLHGSFKCQFCDTVTYYAPDLAVHEITHSNEASSMNDTKERVSIKCPRCISSVFRSLPSYTVHHLESHQSLEPDNPRCPICQKVFKSLGFAKIEKGVMLNHFMKCHNLSALPPNNKVWRCSVCPAYFITSMQLSTHNKEVHCLETKKDISIGDIKALGASLKCEFCQKVIVNSWKLRRHQLRMHKEMVVTQFRFICKFPGCSDSRFPDNYKLKVHIRVKHKDVSRNTLCMECGSTFPNKAELTSHMIVAHNKSVDSDDDKKPKPKVKKSRNIQCPDCGKVLSNPTKLRRHQLRIHKETFLKLTCKAPSCNLRFPDEIRMKRHCLRVHPDISKKILCIFCGTLFPNEDQLQDHVARHPKDLEVKRNPKDVQVTPVKKVRESKTCIKCIDCGEMYSTWWNLRNHQIRIHGKISAAVSGQGYMCIVPECGSRFSDKSELELHLKNDHIEEDFRKQDVLCTICGKTMKESNLRRHMKQHEEGEAKKLNEANKVRMKKKKEKNDGRRLCPDCGIILVSSCNLRNHQLRKHKDTVSNFQFVCDLPECDARFPNKISLLAHINSKHAKSLKNKK